MNLPVYSHLPVQIQLILDSSDIDYCSVWHTNDFYNAGTLTVGANMVTNKDPLFVNAGAGNLRLKSRTGHWVGPGASVFSADEDDSPCIDMGLPSSSYANEQMPNGGVVNLGRYGNTYQASLSWMAVISNLPPTEKTATSAILNGYLGATSVSPAYIYCYWGTNDGTNVESSWEYGEYFGEISASNSLSTNSTSLTIGVVYYYRYYVSNAVGVVWATPSMQFTTMAPDSDSDGDGVLNADEVLCGTDASDPLSYLRIMTGDLTNTADVALSLYLGANRSFQILSCNTAGAAKSALVNLTNSGAMCTNVIVDTNVVSLTPQRFYILKVNGPGGVSYTNTQEWAMFRQDRPASQRFLICVPVNYTGAGSNTLNGMLGQQLARGLYGNSSTSLADKITIRMTNTWREFFLSTNSQGVSYWWDPLTLTTGNVLLTPGTAMWVDKNATAAARTNTVFVGYSWTANTVSDFTFGENDWTLFGWPLPQAKNHINMEYLGRYSTPSNQLGFENSAIGGSTFDQKYPARNGDQIWVWQDNTWKKQYWLMNNYSASGTNWNGKWWDSLTGNFADFSLEAGQAFYYRHYTNQYGGTNFTWKPQN